MEDENNFGSRLKKAREKKGFSQTELANLLGYKSYKSVSEWEVGKQQPPIKLLVKIAETLGVSTDYLLFGHRDYMLEKGEMILSAEEVVQYQKLVIKDLNSQNDRLKNIEVVSKQG